MKERIKRLLQTAVGREALVEYLLEKSPMVRKYIERMSEITGNREEIVMWSRPVMNFIKQIVGQ